jgi:hypothetical protein
MSYARTQQIDEILKDLEGLKKRGFENQYAVDENIKFFEAMRSPFKYIKWLINEKPKIDGSRLLELSDFPLGHNRWEDMLQRELLKIEQWKFPDNLARFRKSMLGLLQHLKSDKRLILLNLGCGPMELERQIIKNYRANNNQQKIVFVGIDMSGASLSLAEENIKSTNIPLEKVSSLGNTVLTELNAKHSGDQFYAVLFKGDAMKIDQYFKKGEVDILFYTKFRHHLTNNQRIDFDKMALNLSDHFVEDDLLNNLFMFTVPLIGRSQWKRPVLLNGGMFSALRCPVKKEIQQLSLNWSIKITPDGYTKVYDACRK